MERQIPTSKQDRDGNNAGPLLLPFHKRYVRSVVCRFSWGKNTVVFATCPAPGRLARLQNWIQETLPVSSLFGGGAGGGGALPKKGAAAAVVEDVVVGGIPTKEELLTVIKRFEER